MEGLIDCFQRAVHTATAGSLLPVCDWSEWVFKPQKGRKDNTYASSTVLSTAHRYMNSTGLKVDIPAWTHTLIHTVHSDPLCPPQITDMKCVSGWLHVTFHSDDTGNTQEGVFIKPVGVFETCFSEKFGTPRQSMYSLDARGTIHLYNHISPDSLLGITTFSHIWVLFLFHEAQGSLQAKVRPPRLDGVKQGVFATRTPHRPNPIGMSVLRVLEVTERLIRVSGVDVITGTPVLDIKPYHPADLVPDAQFPAYIHIPLDLLQVLYRPEAEHTIRSLCSSGKLTHYGPTDDIIPIISSILAQDPSTIHSKSTRPTEEIAGLSFDTLDIVYIRKPPVVEVVEATWVQERREGRGELRTERWMKEVMQRIDGFNQ